MKNAAIVLFAALIVTLLIVSAQATDVGVDINLSFGNRPKPAEAIVVPPPPPAPLIVVDEPPEFVSLPGIGFYAAIGVPYDLFYLSNNYYLFRGNAWYRAPYFNGPWTVVKHKSLPPGLRRHKYERIVYLRDEEYRHFRDDRDHYRGRFFRPEKAWKEERKEARERWKEERKWEKEERKRHKHRDHDDD